MTSLNRKIFTLSFVKNKFITLFLVLIVFPCFSREIIVGVINDNPHYYTLFHNNTIKKQKIDVITLVKNELKRAFKYDTVTFKYIDYDDGNLFKASKDIEKQIKSIKPHIIFGPYSFKILYYLKDTIRRNKIPFVSHDNSLNLRNLDNDYTPYEWNDTITKLAIDTAKKILKKNHLKIGAFVQVTDDYSKDTFETAKEYLKEDKIFTIKLLHSRVKDYWSYKYKLDSEISKMIDYAPDVLLNPNSMDSEKISYSIIIKMMEKGFKGIFLDTGSWGCSELSISRNKIIFKNVHESAIGISVAHKKCFSYFGRDEKNFRNKILTNDDKYYSSTGLFYKTLSHVLSSILESHLPINSSNIQKIIQKNSYFKGFSGKHYNLFKKKDSPEFLYIYKFYFEKNFRIENLTSLNLYQKQDSNKESSDK